MPDEGFSSDTVGPQQPENILSPMLQRATSIGADKGEMLARQMVQGMGMGTLISAEEAAAKLGISVPEWLARIKGIGKGQPITIGNTQVPYKTATKSRGPLIAPSSTNPGSDIAQMGGNSSETTSMHPHVMLGALLDEMSKRHGADYLKVLEKYKNVPLKILHDAYTENPYIQKIAGDSAERSGLQNITQNLVPNLRKILNTNAMTYAAKKGSEALGLQPVNMQTITDKVRSIFGGNDNAEQNQVR